MAETKIEWTDAVWNPARGCSRVSEGCRNCYAERMAARFVNGSGPLGIGPFFGFAKDGKWTGEVALIQEKLSEPLHWRKPRRVFVNSMSDLFHEKLSIEDIASVFDVMACATLTCHESVPIDEHDSECWSGPPHTFQVLTKRPARMLEVLSELPHLVGEKMPGDSVLSISMETGRWPLPNVWLGVSVEDQKTADERIPLLLKTPAAVLFVSYEPALGPVDFSAWLGPHYTTHPQMHGRETGQALADIVRAGAKTLGAAYLDWIIAGGESGPGARPSDLAWFRSARDQCQAASVPFFMKQITERGRKLGMTAWPKDLRVRQWPEVNE